MDAKHELARNLRAARIERGLTQSEVARTLGLHRPSISEMEAGRRSVTSEELAELSRLFSIPVSNLLPATAVAAIDASEEVREAIDRMVRVVVERFDPELVILFGSHARGTAGPDSDVDLLVVMDIDGSRRGKAVEIGVALKDIRLPKDVIVTTPEEFAWRREVVGTIERPAVREGRVLYARE